MQLSYKDIHPDFSLNGINLSFFDLSEVSYSLIKEGEAYEVAIGGFFADWIDHNDWVEVRTSGSTGVPKIIRLGKQQMVNSALATGKYFNLNSGDSALLCLPAEYIAGKMMLVRAMMLGLQLDTIEPFSQVFFDPIKKYTFCAMVPMQIEKSMTQVNGIRTIIVGGAPISNSLREKIENIEPEVFETFGMTETVTHIAVKRINHRNGNESEVFNTLPSVTIGKDERECLVINAPSISNDSIVTNDIVKLISDTAFEWLGRYDNVINSGGVKLFPEQVEKKLVPYLSNRFFVSGEPDQKLGQRLILVVEGKINKDTLIQQLQSSVKFSKFEIPKEVYFVNGFIDTTNGKVSRKNTLALISKR